MKFRGGSNDDFLDGILHAQPPVQVTNIYIRVGDRVRIRRSGKRGTVIDFSPRLGLRVDLGEAFDEWVRLEDVEKL